MRPRVSLTERMLGLGCTCARVLQIKKSNLVVLIMSAVFFGCHSHFAKAFDGREKHVLGIWWNHSVNPSARQLSSLKKLRPPKGDEQHIAFKSSDLNERSFCKKVKSVFRHSFLLLLGYSLLAIEIKQNLSPDIPSYFNFLPQLLTSIFPVRYSLFVIAVSQRSPSFFHYGLLQI
jgi:hypothetical protein